MIDEHLKLLTLPRTILFYKIYKTKIIKTLLKRIIKKFFTKLHSQFNYHTLPVTPFKTSRIFPLKHEEILAQIDLDTL